MGQTRVSNVAIAITMNQSVERFAAWRGLELRQQKRKRIVTDL